MKQKSDLYQAFEELNRREQARLPSQEELENAHEFSPEFEARMEKLLRHHRRKYLKCTGYTVRKSWVVAAIVALVLSISMSAKASRTAIVRFTADILERSASLGHGELDKKYAPDTIEEKREPEWGEDYEEVERYENLYYYIVIMKNTDYGVRVRFTQQLIKSKEGYLDTENRSLYEMEKRGKQEYYVACEDGINVILWNDGEYFYRLQSECSFKELFRLAETLIQEK